MLDLGFIHALKRIAKLLPPQRQTLLFSATMPRAIAALAEDYLADPVKVDVAPAATTVERVEQSVIFVPSERKRDLLAALLRRPELRARACVHPDQARRRSRRRATRRRRHRRGCHSRQQVAAAARARARRLSQRQRPRARRHRHRGARHRCGRRVARHQFRAAERSGRLRASHRPNRARRRRRERPIAFCSDEERPYLRNIEKLTRLTVPVIPMPSALRIADGGAIRQAATSASVSHSASVPMRHKAAPSANGQASAADNGSLPAFLRHHPSGRSAAAHQRAPQRKRTAPNAAGRPR